MEVAPSTSITEGTSGDCVAMNVAYPPASSTIAARTAKNRRRLIRPFARGSDTEGQTYLAMEAMRAGMWASICSFACGHSWLVRRHLLRGTPGRPWPGELRQGPAYTPCLD